MTRYTEIEKALHNMMEILPKDGYTREDVLQIDKARAALALPEDSKVVNAERWYLCSLNDGLFITNTQPSPCGTDIPADWGISCGNFAINISEMPLELAQEIVGAHNGEPMPYKVVRDGDKVRFI